MSDKEKFYRLALNIINYPYDKAVFYSEGRITKIEVYPYTPFPTDPVTLNNYSKLPELEFFLDDAGYHVVKINTAYQLDYIIEQIKKRYNEVIVKALLEGIE